MQRWFCVLAVMVSCSFLSAEVIAQEPGPLPEKYINSSALAEILNNLDTTTLPRARISLKSRGIESYDANSQTWSSEEFTFSQGFRLVNIRGCRVTLKNEATKIIGGLIGGSDPDAVSLGRFLRPSKYEKQLTPKTGVLTIALNQLSPKETKSFQYTKKPDDAKVFGSWRVKFPEGKFYGLRVLEMEITADEGPDLKASMRNAETLMFTFDTQAESESFRIAFSRAIKLCEGK
ncbi:MAG TPA: hypothetical protein VE961_21765 [Pyrinomonadaceae bacterium]|nr:hypothetical protein [Pyrinomonadaceae bacterium]